MIYISSFLSLIFFFFIHSNVITSEADMLKKQRFE